MKRPRRSSGGQGALFPTQSPGEVVAEDTIPAVIDALAALLLRATGSTVATEKEAGDESEDHA